MKPLRRSALSLLALCAAALLSTASAEERVLPDELRVTLYTTQWCGYCKQARSYLTDKGIAHREIDIETHDGRAAFVAVGGPGKGIPLLIAGERRVRGFSAKTYDVFFAQADLR